VYLAKLPPTNGRLGAAVSTTGIDLFGSFTSILPLPTGSYAEASAEAIARYHRKGGRR